MNSRRRYLKQEIQRTAHNCLNNFALVDDRVATKSTLLAATENTKVWKATSQSDTIPKNNKSNKYLIEIAAVTYEILEQK